MMPRLFAALAAAFSAFAGAGAADAAAARFSRGGVSPVQKVVTLLGELEAKIIRDGEEEQKAWTAFVEWCKTGAKDKEFEIKTAKASIEDLSATIGKATSDVMTLSSKIEDLAGEISTNEADLKAATQIREKESKEFAITEKEMMDTVDTLERAINIFERKMHGSALLQTKVNRQDIDKLVGVLRTLIDAAALSLHDKQKLIGLVQNGEETDDESLEAELGAPAPAVYTSHSEGIVDVLEDLKQKAVMQLEEARREETNARHNFELLKQSLVDQITVANKELSESKTSVHDISEKKASSAGDLQVTKKDLADSESVLKNMKSDCMSKASDHESAVKNRAEELKALAAAKKAIRELTAGAASVVYSEPSPETSFLQIRGSNKEASGSHLHTRVDLANFEVVNLVRKLAHEQGSAELTQLAGRISTAMRLSAGSGQDPFAKVKALISDMIERLLREAGEEAQHKAYCDKEMGETKTKMGELKYGIEKLSAKIDKAKADSVDLKDEVATLQSEIVEIVRSQGEADALRKKEHKIYVQSKSDLEQGLSGVRMALKVLRDYYVNEPSVSASLVQQPQMSGMYSKSSGVGTSVIGMLEVVESDFGKSLASVEMNEEAAATSYERLSMENKISKALKDKDVQYKAKEASSLDKSVSELTSDRDSAQSELDAVLQYSSNIRSMCEAKPESYEERKGRREAEISGLKEALQILTGEAVLIQRRHRHHAVLRGGRL